MILQLSAVARIEPSGQALYYGSGGDGVGAGDGLGKDPGLDIGLV